MAFFKKLKDRLFRSSSKLEDGLDSIVAEGGSLEQNIVENLQTSAEASVLVDTEQQSASIDEADPSLGGKKPLDDHFAAQSDQHISAPSFAPQAKPIEAVDAYLTDSASAQQGESLKATSSLTSAQGSARGAMPPPPSSSNLSEAHARCASASVGYSLYTGVSVAPSRYSDWRRSKVVVMTPVARPTKTTKWHSRGCLGGRSVAAVSIGAPVLKVEVACVAALSLVMDEMRQRGGARCDGSRAALREGLATDDDEDEDEEERGLG